MFCKWNFDRRSHSALFQDLGVLTFSTGKQTRGRKGLMLHLGAVEISHYSAKIWPCCSDGDMVILQSAVLCHPLSIIIPCMAKEYLSVKVLIKDATLADFSSLCCCGDVVLGLLCVTFELSVLGIPCRNRFLAFGFGFDLCLKTTNGSLISCLLPRLTLILLQSTSIHIW